MHDTVVWVLIILCIIHSGMFSGLNLALFSLSRMSLEIAADDGNEGARRVLQLRMNSNFLLTTILWGNVAVNTLLTLLSDSVLAGLGAFVFSTVGITMFGEIIPQAYFSRYALRIGAFLVPVLRLYQILLYPVAKPSAMLLDLMLGREGVTYLRERDLRAVVEKHMKAEEADLDKGEGIGILNYLMLDDLPVKDEGERIHPESIVMLPIHVDLPIMPTFGTESGDEFVRLIQRSGHKWVVLTDESGEPRLVLDCDAFIRGLFELGEKFNGYEACHRPILVRDARMRLGKILPKLVVHAKHQEDDVIDHDIILLWGDERRIITGADILGRMLRGIATRKAKTIAEKDKLVDEKGG